MAFIGNNPKFNTGTFRPLSADPVSPVEGMVQYADGTVRPEGLWVYKNGAWSTFSSSSLNSYITNPDFETNVTGWTTYADAAQSTPVDGTGGSPSVTFTRTTTTPLDGTGSGLFTKDAANRQGQGVSSDFTIDNADKGKFINVQFNYEIPSGTFVTGDVGIFIYDVTNSQLIVPSSVNIPSIVGTGKFSSSFISNSTSTSYRLIYHVATTSAIAYTLEIDNVVVNSVTPFVGASISNWQTYVPTVTGLGTIASTSFRWRQVGDTVEVIGTFVTGTPAASLASISLPNSYNLDSSKITVNNTTSAAGLSVGHYTSTGTNLFGNIVTATATSTSLVYLANVISNATNSLIPSNGNASLQATRELSIMIKVPILGLSSSNTIITNNFNQFCTDTAPLVYAGSSSYSLSTLSNAPVGTFITYTYAINTNTRSQTNASPPTQTTSDMNVNGILVYTRAYNAASTAAQPAAIAIQIGKGLKGVSLGLYKSSGKTTSGSLDLAVFSNDANQRGLPIKYYNESTGIIILDAGWAQNSTVTSNNFLYSDVSIQTNGYIVINASQSPSILGIPQTLPRIATLSDVKASGTNGGGSATGAYQTRTLNTLVDTSSIVSSLSANQFVLPAGTYYIEASAPSQRSDRHKLRLRNITNSSSPIIGTAENVDGSVSVCTRSFLSGEVTITTPTTFEIQHYTQTALATVGLGNPTSNGDSEVYAICKITKLSN